MSQDDVEPPAIDAPPAIPAAQGTDAQTLTRDIEGALEREVRALVARTASARGVSFRQAAVHVLARLRTL